MLILVGCGSSADENKPISEVKAEAETMSVEELKASAMDYKKAIEAKNPEVEKLTEELKEIPIADALGDDAKSLKAEIETLNKAIQALKERYNVYFEKLKEQNADVSDLTL